MIQGMRWEERSGYDTLFFGISLRATFDLSRSHVETRTRLVDYTDFLADLVLWSPNPPSVFFHCVGCAVHRLASAYLGHWDPVLCTGSYDVGNCGLALDNLFVWL
jgi:hypothetical protein